MAARYWVLGTGTWSTSNIVNWSATSGGLGGASVPSTGDTTIFDANSGTGTVTLNYNPVVQTLNISAYTGTLAFGTQNITVNLTTANQFTGGTGCTITGTPVINISTTTGSIGISAGAMTEANSISFNITGTNTSASLAVGGSVKNLSFGTATGALSNASRTIYGNLTLSSTMSLTAGTAITTFAATSGTQTITSNTKTMDFPITFSGTATYQLVDALTSGSGRTMTLTSGTLDLNDKTLTTGLFSSTNSNTRSILFGTTGNITVNGTGTVWTTATITNFSYTGTSTVNLTNSSATTRTLTQGAGTAAQAISVYVKAGTGQVNFGTTNGVFQNIDFTGSTAIFNLNNSINCYGNFLITATSAFSTNGLTFAGTSGTQTVTTNSFICDFPITIAAPGATLQLVDALNNGTLSLFGLSSGTLDLNNKTLTTKFFSSTNTNTRSILFGTTGNFVITGSNTTVWNMTTATGFTYTGTPTVNLTYSGSVGTRLVTCGNTAGGSEATALDFNISAGSDIVGIYIYLRNVNFTGFTGTCPNNTRTLYGSLTFSSGMTVGGGTGILTFASTLIQQNITAATKTIDNPIALSGTQTYQLQDALTMGVTRTLTFNSGTLDLNDKTLTTNTFSSANSNVRSIAFGTLGEINLVGTSGTIWTTSTNTNFSVTGTPTVNATDTSVGNTRTFNQGTNALSNQAVSIYVKAGSGTANFTSTGATFQTIDLTGFTGTVGHSSIFVLGDYVLPAGVTETPTANIIQFVGTAATQKITTNSNVIDFPIAIGRALITTAATGNGTTATLTFASTGYYPIVGQTITVSGVVPAGYNGTFTVTASSATSVSYLNATTAAQTTAGTVNLATTVQLQDAFTMGARQLTFNSGTLDLNNNTLTTQNVSATTSAPRTILFGTAEINVTGSNTTIWTNISATGYPFIATGTKVVNCTYSGSVGSRNISSTITANPDLYSLNFNITAGSDIFSIQGNRQYNNINFTGFSGTCVVSSSSTASANIYGNWTCPASGAGAIFLSSTTPYGLIFQGTAGKTQTLTSNQYQFDCPIVKTGSTTGTLLLADDLVVTDATSTGLITLSFGIFNSNGKNVTCAVFDAENTNTKTFTITNSTFTVTGGSSTEGFIFQSGNTTWNVTGSNIVFTTSGTAVYYGGQASSITYPQVTMGGTGQLILGYVNTTTGITTLTNTVQPCTVSVSTTSQLTVTNFNLNGTAGNLVTFNSSVAGTARTVSKASGTVNAYYLAIQDSNAAGGATWRAISSVNNGNNTGWFFDYTETVIEASILADTPSTTASFLSNISEPLTIEDTPVGNATFAGVITEDTTLTDTQSITAAFASAITEAATLADAQSVVLTIVSDISEAITLADSQTVIANFASIVLENIGVAESESVVASFTAVISENANLADVESVLASFVSSLSEALTAADSSVAIKIFNSAITEDIQPADIQTALRTQYALISENLVPADAITVIASFSSQITENLVLLDSPILRGWFKIDDDQTVSWGAVNNTNSAVWAAVNDGQMVSWNNVNNANSTTWTNIGDDQNPVWTSVDNTQ